MVSLSNESRRSGGYFFQDDHTIQGHDSDEPLLDSPVYNSEFDPPFRVINTTWAVAVQIVLLVLVAVGVVVTPELCGKSCGVPPGSVILYTQAVLWAVLLGFDRYYRHKHNLNRIYGYLEFYRQTRNIRRVPLLVNSGTLAVLIIVNQILADVCPAKKKCGGVNSEAYLQIISVLHIAVIIPFLAIYLNRTVKFNRSNATPDVAQDELMTSFIQSSMSSEIGFRDEQYAEQVLEKQADMIRYLKQHNAQLGKRILTLTSADLQEPRS